MPAKVRIRKEDIINKAIELIREDGIGSLNARSLSSRLGCSTQPILYQFSTMEDLLDEVYRAVDQYHTEYLIRAAEENGNPLLSLGMAYVRFSHEEKNLFSFLFSSNRLEGEMGALFDDDRLDFIIEELKKATGMGEEESRKLFRHLFFTVHGAASLIASNALIYKEEEVREILEDIFREE